MLVKAKKHLKTLFNYAVTVIFSVVIIVFGISFFSRATTVTTTIGENISTNDLIVYGNATTTGAHYIGGNLTVAGDFTVSGAQTLSGAITIPYFTATSTIATSTIAGGFNVGSGRLVSDFSSGNTWLGSGNLGIGTTSPYAKLSVAGIGAFDDYVRASYFTATSTTATSTFPYLTSTQSNLGTVVGGTWQGAAIGAQYGGTGQNFSASTGLIYLNSGTASASSTIAVNVGGTGATSFTSGSLIFSNGSILTQNNANLYWDNTNARLGLGTTSPYAKLSVAGIGAFDDYVRASYFTATSTTATSTLPYLTSTQSNVGTVVGGTWQGAAIGIAYGGTGLASAPSYGQILLGNASSGYTLSATSSLGIALADTSGTLSVAKGGTGLSSYTINQLLYASGTGTIGQIATSSLGLLTTNVAEGDNLYWTNTRFDNRLSSTTTLPNLTTLLGLANATTSLLTVSNGAWFTSGNVGIGTTSPYAKLSVSGIGVFDDYIRASYFTATSTTATSTLPYLTSTQMALTGLSAGSIPFIGAGGILSQNNSNLYWDNTNARLGVSSSTPYAKLSVTNSGTGPSFIVEDAASPDNTQFIIDASGNVGIGTSTPTAKLTVQGAGTGLNQTFAVFDSTNATSTFVVLDNGYVGVGTSTPWGRFSIEQGTNDTNVFIVADAGTSTPHMRIDGGGVTTINRLNTGPMAFDTNAGAVSWINMPVNSTVATGTIESYTAMIDDVSILTIYGEAAGAGLIGTTSVGIGTTTPVGYFTINASTTAPMAALSVWNVNTAPEGPIAAFYDGGTEVFKIDASGRLGIGTSTFTSTLTIGTANGKVEIANGGLCVDSDGGCNASTTGRISAVSFVTAASDIAENYYSDETLTAGDIVITKGGSMVGRAGQKNQNSIIGIVSTKPGIILGLENDNPEQGMPPFATGIYPVALAGRVPVKVNLEGGNISVGDPLTISSEAGVAKKASEPGKIIGYALEDYDGPTIQNNGQIPIFINITYWFPPDYFTADIADSADDALNAALSGDIVSQSFNWVLEQFKDIGLAIADGVVSAREFVAEKITAKKAAVDALEMKDAATGEVYCVKMENGELNKILGECPEN